MSIFWGNIERPDVQKSAHERVKHEKFFAPGNAGIKEGKMSFKIRQLQRQFGSPIMAHKLLQIQTGQKVL